ncbi:MAG: hypothetical protein HXX18_08770 [Bacteroidetes bacterium]|nr:hypothetical protein [Bacteroidota bacterium]
MKIILKLLFFTFIVFFASSCEKDNTFNTKKYDTPEAIYDFPNNKLWKHRVNTAKEANEALKEYNGIELDVFFVDGASEFQTGHDSPSGISLESYFDSITNCSQYYYWLDFKNLSNYNISSAVGEIKNIINKYNLQKKLIVESDKADLLNSFKLSDIFTSYWIPDVSKNLIDYFAEKELIDELETTLTKYQFNVISAHYNMLPFMEKYLKRYNCHIWTNGLISEEDKQKILNFSYKQNIKVILVDYDTNFLN